MVKNAEISWNACIIYILTALIAVFSVFVRNPGLHLQQISKFNLNLEVLDWINYVQCLTAI